MWPLTSQRERCTSGLENFQSSAKKDFFNTIRHERSYPCSGRDTTQRSRLKFIDHSPRRSRPARLPRVFAEGASEECGRVRRRRVAAARSKCLRAPGPQAPNARETSEL